MHIIEGELPERQKAWHVLIPRSPDQPLGKSWQLALLLAKGGTGNVLLAMAVADDSRKIWTKPEN